jgi:hypothetical protein
MKNNGGDHSLAHGFFHTMVVMGSALALGCGGESRSAHGASDGSAGMNTGGAGGGTGNGGIGGGTLSGGTGAVGGGAALGGSGGTAGVISIGGPSGGAGAPELPDCPPAQWSCGNGGCDGYDLTHGAGECSCELSRPKTPADCRADETMVCFDGTQYDASGRVVATSVPYACKCFARQPDCSTTCDVALAAIFDRERFDARCLNADPTAALDPNQPVLCGCAPVFLR